MNATLYLTRNITLEEFIASNKVLSLNSDDNPNNDIDNSLPINLMSSAHNICNLLQDIRNEVNKEFKPLKEHKIDISSGYRCDKLNEVIGGTKGSQHSKAEAVDFTVTGLDILTTFKFIVKHFFGQFDQIIYEVKTTKKGNITRWIHISRKLRNEENRNEILYTYDGKNYFRLMKKDVESFTPIQ